MKRLVPLLLLACAHQQTPSAPSNVSLRFERFGVELKTLDLAAILAVSPEAQWRAFDPYYAKEKGWRSVELAPLLRSVFAEGLEGELQFTALDGYQVVMSIEKALEPGAFLAFADLDGAFEPIGPQRANPGPLYFVWRGEQQRDLVTHPRPWALAKVNLMRFEDVYANTLPPRRDARIDEGQAIFRTQCLRCHAINRQGGRVGPELNVPRNVTEYRQLEQLKAFVKNPLSFRYGNMPPFAHLTDSQLDAVFAYLSVMKEKQIDDGRAAPH